MPTKTENIQNTQNSRQTKSKYRSVKKDASKITISSSITAVSHDVTVGGINLISRSRVNTSSSARLLTPVDAEKDSPLFTAIRRTRPSEKGESRRVISRLKLLRVFPLHQRTP